MAATSWQTAATRPPHDREEATMQGADRITPYAHGHAWLAQAPRRRPARWLVIAATVVVAAAAGLAVAARDSGTAFLVAGLAVCLVAIPLAGIALGAIAVMVADWVEGAP